MNNNFKINKGEYIMIKRKLTLAGLTLLAAMTNLSADPKANVDCCEPEPVGGLETLEKNTIYPVFERLQGNEADLVVCFTVDTGGNISNVFVAQSGGTMFDRSAMLAVLNTQWNPAMQNGYPVKVTYELPFMYRNR
ncbi:MAG: energy transducer TonB [Candidatus Marinimicrobia bacterium]|nr:energy transducer TonB [Candidatus Neomarinimicrobiota bacterium]